MVSRNPSPSGLRMNPFTSFCRTCNRTNASLRREMSIFMRHGCVWPPGLLPNCVSFPLDEEILTAGCHLIRSPTILILRTDLLLSSISSSLKGNHRVGGILIAIWQNAFEEAMSSVQGCFIRVSSLSDVKHRARSGGRSCDLVSAAPPRKDLLYAALITDTDRSLQNVLCDSF